MKTAQTILAQLGGNRFIAMTGAQQLASTGHSIQFKFGSGATNRANFCRIELCVNDTYTMTFLSQRGFNPTKQIEQFCDVQCGQLKSLFAQRTGFILNL